MAKPTQQAYLLNQYYTDDTAARICVFTNQNWQLQEELKAGYLNRTDFKKAGEEICGIFHPLLKLKPFDLLDMELSSAGWQHCLQKKTPIS